MYKRTAANAAVATRAPESGIISVSQDFRKSMYMYNYICTPFISAPHI